MIPNDFHISLFRLWALFFLLLYFPYRILAASAFIKQCLLIFFRSTYNQTTLVYSIAIINRTLGGTKESSFECDDDSSSNCK
ncbi:hypothetical protein PISMIDRAFT_447654 [Pisolithus microcarpus 441]|uniref:Uncharacterized protein n=1 Tax=Pisolithus microcarpus 441 TaxID=765257 RepID=A0A0C9ZVF1_9AGAM|nr:hypothetical protein PISMIDRAFT_447654 [Pisolithus microcarpus 441]